jgi:hypothetical protein
MPFSVRDLMIDILPPAMQMRCLPDTTPAPAPPCQPPSCQKNSAKAFEEEEPGVSLAGLEVLRDQLRETLGA